MKNSKINLKFLKRKILTNFLNERYSYNISENFGTDFYNTGMLTLLITQLEQAGMQHINKLSSQGTNLYFSFKVRHTQFSRYGFTIEVVENTKFPILNSAKSFIKESGFDTYTTSVGIKNEFEKKKGQKYE